ncbi:MAG: T9SS type A sorting domain-containing protein, partial [Candidatus Cloacimonetes bacterium]|nr:T9SS type A sorting domain-containing protein [Candidatus Cloacimonadota bacterium]
NPTSGVQNNEVFKLEEDPTIDITPMSSYNSGSSSTFGHPNIWSGGDSIQVFTHFSFGVDDGFLPQTGELLTNYPNPFSKSTIISFNLAPNLYRTKQIEIYNIKGQLVKQLKLEINEVIWDGKDNTGKPVSSGIYFIKLDNSDNYSYVKKMLLLK